MKRQLLFTLLFFFSLCLHAQIQLQNPSFENWNDTTNPAYWATYLSLNTCCGATASDVTIDYSKYTDGLASVKLMGRPGYVSASSAYNGNKEGCPFQQQPDSIAFDYQYIYGGYNNYARVGFETYQRIQ